MNKTPNSQLKKKFIIIPVMKISLFLDLGSSKVKINALNAYIFSAFPHFSLVKFQRVVSVSQSFAENSIIFEILLQFDHSLSVHFRRIIGLISEREALLLPSLVLFAAGRYVFQF